MTTVASRIANSVSYVARIYHEVDFSWQAQYLVKFNCHISRQAQCSVKFGMIAGARNVVFPYKMLATSAKSNLVCEAGCGLTFSCLDHGRRIANDVSFVFSKFLSHFGRSFFVAGAVFGEVGQ